MTAPPFSSFSRTCSTTVTVSPSRKP
uniref:Uncharacterized protein n=1 Tax=Rhizophora mucronata TaxID=61149 RepID=A0A2P2N4V7_RHIMU